MKETDPKAIQTLNNPGTIDLITNRLDNALKDKWFDHQSTLLRGSDVPEFEDLADWIEKRAEVARNTNNSRPSSPIHTYAQATQNTKDPITTSYHTPQQPQNQYKQRTSPGDKEYRDTLRQRRSSYPTQQSPPQGRSPSPTQSSSPRTRSPSPNRSRDTTPKPTPHPIQNRMPNQNALNKKCAWCTENGTEHNHTTPNCLLLKNAKAMDQWKVLYKHKICDRCLESGHYWKDCVTKNPRCTSCNISHHQSIACRPAERISTYPNAQ